MDELGVVQECAQNKFINKFSRLPNTIEKPIYHGNTGFSVEFTFSHHSFPDCLIVTTIYLSWEEVDAWVAGKYKARL